jgi:branched-chain amino acid transport system permease protein
MTSQQQATTSHQIVAPAAISRSFSPAMLWHLLPWVIALAFFFVGDGYHSLGTNILVMILFALSLDLALGYAGIITLGHAAFFGAGAYAAGIFAIHFNADPILGLLVATAVAGLLGLLTGMLILHTRGETMLMLTLAIAAIFYEVANHARWLTGGDDGLSGIRVTPVFGLFRFDLWGKTAFLYSLSVLFIWFVIAALVVHSPFGRSLDGIRQNTKRMRAIGTPVWWRLVAMYALSAAMAGSAGALTAQSTRLVGLSTLELLTSGIVAVMLVLGGERRLYGAFIGATIYVVVQDFAGSISPFIWMFVIGFLLIIIVLFFEGGLMGIIDSVVAKLQGKPLKNDNARETEKPT